MRRRPCEAGSIWKQAPRRRLWSGSPCPLPAAGSGQPREQPSGGFGLGKGKGLVGLPEVMSMVLPHAHPSHPSPPAPRLHCHHIPMKLGLTEADTTSSLFSRTGLNLLTVMKALDIWSVWRRLGMSLEQEEDVGSPEAAGCKEEPGTAPHWADAPGFSSRWGRGVSWVPVPGPAGAAPSWHLLRLPGPCTPATGEQRDRWD